MMLKDSGRRLGIRVAAVLVSLFLRIDPPTEAAGPESVEAAYELLNGIRSELHLPPVEPHRALEIAAIRHAQYLDLNIGTGMELHLEQPGHAAFFSRSPIGRARRAGFDPEQIVEVISSLGNPSAAVNEWLGTLYHRLPLIHPRASRIGLASTALYSVAVINLGRRRSETTVVYPYPGQTDVPPRWNGNEVPDPLPEIDSPLGPTITVQFPGRAEYRIESAGLSSADGDSLPLFVLYPFADDFIGNTLAFWSRTPLRAYRTYEARVTYRVYGIRLDSLAWSFRTGRLERRVAVVHTTQADNLLAFRFEASSSFDPVAQAAYERAVGSSEADRRAEALDELERALEIDPEFTAALVLKARLLEATSDYGGAARVYEVLRGIEPDSDFLIYNLARALMREENYREALKLFERIDGKYRGHEAITADMEYCRKKLE